jgi:hypothetical protein
MTQKAAVAAHRGKSNRIGMAGGPRLPSAWPVKASAAMRRGVKGSLRPGYPEGTPAPRSTKIRPASLAHGHLHLRVGSLLAAQERPHVGVTLPLRQLPAERPVVTSLKRQVGAEQGVRRSLRRKHASRRRPANPLTPAKELTGTTRVQSFLYGRTSDLFNSEQELGGL